MNKFKQYLTDNSIDFKPDTDSTINIDNFGVFMFIESKEDILILPSFELNLSEEEKLVDADFYCFQFGENFYYTENGSDLTLTPLKYLNKYVNDLGLSVPFISLHGGYELLNGSREYKDWIKKAKFLDIKTLGICEKNTLAGTLKFQIACKDNNIKPIIGEQIVVKDGEGLFQFKCYVKNKQGWTNLLLINKEITVTNYGFIDKDVFLKLLDGLFIVIDTKYSLYSKILPYDLNIHELYYQIDTVEFSNQEKDKEYLLNLKDFINQHKIKPIFINDAYYLDKQDFRVKKILNAISNIRDYKSENQYFKTVEENFELFIKLFGDENKGFSLFEESINNLINLVDRCDFEIETGVKHLPKYIMTEEEKKKHKTRDNMFWSLIQEGSDIKLPKEGDLSKYEERIIEEYEVINQVKSEAGDGIDYFLISWDIIRFCKENDILVGLSRGSSAGSLLAFLLDITKINPFDYDLLFSRFLNVGRVKKGSLPDFDIDFQTLRRDEVKKYIEQKYGIDNVCSVGTYTTLQLRAALKDIARQRNVDYGTVNYISQLLDKDSSNWEDIFKTAVNKQQVKDFVLDNPDVIDDIQLILKQPKSNSIHACATIIVPENQNIYQYFPVRLGEKDGELIIISEWEGNELEIAGFLKEDILGVKQLDKYKLTLDLIKKHYDIDIDIYNLPLDVAGVYELFQKGHNGDVFQFGTKGLEAYCKEVKPINIFELIDTVSLYRPGAMDVNAHNEYVFRKFGEREVTYHWGTNDILKHTYGLIVYQESVMQIVQQLADFDSVEADDVRRAMGKKKKDVIDKYKDQFLNKVIEKGCPKDEAEIIWHELEVHSGYSFNRSHAAAYAITGYIGQWLKYYYPLQYWISAFQFDDPNPKKSNIGRFISEINRTNNLIKIKPPDINESGEVFMANPDKMEMYWSIDKVKQVGEKALESIMTERNEKGEFFSLEDFLSRVEKRVVNKAVVINLILSGSFDELESITSVGDRKILINKYYEFTGAKRDKDDIYLGNHEDYWWQIKQKEISGFGDIDYLTFLKRKTEFNTKQYISGFNLDDKDEGSTVIVAGLINRFMIRTTKKNDEFCRVTIDNNNEEIDIVIWNETFEGLIISDFEVGKVLVMNGKVVNDTYKGGKVIHSFEKTKVNFI